MYRYSRPNISRCTWNYIHRFSWKGLIKTDFFWGVRLMEILWYNSAKLRYGSTSGSCSGRYSINWSSRFCAVLLITGVLRYVLYRKASVSLHPWPRLPWMNLAKIFTGGTSLLGLTVIGEEVPCEGGNRLSRSKWLVSSLGSHSKNDVSLEPTRLTSWPEVHSYQVLPQLGKNYTPESRNGLSRSKWLISLLSAHSTSNI